MKPQRKRTLQEQREIEKKLEQAGWVEEERAVREEAGAGKNRPWSAAKSSKGAVCDEPSY